MKLSLTLIAGGLAVLSDARVLDKSKLDLTNGVAYLILCQPISPSLKSLMANLKAPSLRYLMVKFKPLHHRLLHIPVVPPPLSELPFLSSPQAKRKAHLLLLLQDRQLLLLLSLLNLKGRQHPAPSPSTKGLSPSLHQPPLLRLVFRPEES